MQSFYPIGVWLRYIVNTFVLVQIEWSTCTSTNSAQPNTRNTQNLWRWAPKYLVPMPHVYAFYFRYVRNKYTACVYTQRASKRASERNSILCTKSKWYAFSFTHSFDHTHMPALSLCLSISSHSFHPYIARSMVSCVQMYAGSAYTFAMLVSIANCDQVSQKHAFPAYARVCLRVSFPCFRCVYVLFKLFEFGKVRMRLH